MFMMLPTLSLLLLLLGSAASFRLGARHSRDIKLQATVAVFGGTGVLGREAVYQALQGGDNVVVLGSALYTLYV